MKKDKLMKSVLRQTQYKLANEDDWKYKVDKQKIK
jgi:hypothetical protein